MAVSLSQVQAAYHGQVSQTGAGPLALHVLHKTEALLAKLAALNTSKTHQVQVLSAQANGRATVQVGGLDLAVKASLPLKAGEVLHLKFEQVGSAHRFVQPVEGKGGHSGAARPAGAEGRPSAANDKAGLIADPRSPRELRGPAKQGGPPPPALKSASAHNPAVHQTPYGRGSEVGRDKAPISHHAPAQSSSQNKPAQVGHPSTPGQRASAALPQSAVPPSRLDSGGQSAALQQKGGVGGGVQTALSVSPHLASQTTTTALLRAVAEALPDLVKPEGQVQSGQSPKGPLPKGAAGQGGLLGQAAPQATKPGDLALEAASSYKVLASKGGEESLELKSFGQRAADVTLELPLLEGAKPMAVSLFLDQDRGPSAHDKEERGYGVRFQLETQETGPVTAELALRGLRVRLGFWAERESMVGTIQERLPLLEDRLLASGFEIDRLAVRHGAPDISSSASLKPLHMDHTI